MLVTVYFLITIHWVDLDNVKCVLNLYEILREMVY